MIHCVKQGEGLVSIRATLREGMTVKGEPKVHRVRQRTQSVLGSRCSVLDLEIFIHLMDSRGTFGRHEHMRIGSEPRSFEYAFVYLTTLRCVKAVGV